VRSSRTPFTLEPGGPRSSRATRAPGTSLTDSMLDDPKKADPPPRRSQPPVPLALAAFAASVVGFMLVVVALFALMRFVGRVR